MKSAPKIAPEIDARPPTTMPTSRLIDRTDREAVGRDELHRDRAERAGDAGVHGADAEGERLVARRVDAHRRGGDRMVADRDQRPADAPAQQVPAEDEHDDGDREREQVEPLVGAELQAERCVGLDDDDALHAAGPVLDGLVLQQLRHRHAEREGGQREVVAFEPQRRQPEQEADDEAHGAGDRHRRPVRHAEPVHQDRRDVGADRVERAVAERDLAVVAGQDVEAEQRDRVDQHQRELERAVVADQERQRAGGDQQHARARSSCRRRRLAAGESGAAAAGTTALIRPSYASHVHRPNRPDGLTSSTPMISTSATVSFSSLPMT